MKIQPHNDYVLVIRKENDEKLPSGLFIPATVQDKQMEATVVAVGPGKMLEDGSRRRMSVEAGNTVLIEKWAGNEVEIDGVKHLFIREGEILAAIAR